MHIFASPEQFLVLNNTGYEDIVGRLKANKEQISEEDFGDSDQSKLLFPKSQDNRKT